MTLRGVIVSFILTIVLSIMVLGYAALQQRIDIEAEATVDSTYKVQINSVKEKSATGDARSTSVFQYNNLSTTFHVGLTNSTDTITYEIELNNLGTVDAILNNTEILIDGSNNMKVVRLGVKNGDILLANSLKVLTITVKLSEVTSSEQTANITINLDYTRLKGGTGEVVPEVYPTYQIGDKVTFAGSDWYVIKNSPSSDDYVVLLKATIITNAELGSYAYSNKKEMPYYFDDTCHYKNNGYSDDQYECNNKNNYSISKVKQLLENNYISVLGESNLKSILLNDVTYKLRLITVEELQENLGYGDSTTKNDSVPTWIYQNFGGIWSYWTMTEHARSDFTVDIGSDGNIYGRHINSTAGVRPVINLYKDAIEE